ncbi:hypothetical protein KXV85_005348, partial [Aspergillus fumigatus]
SRAGRRRRDERGRIRLAARPDGHPERRRGRDAGARHAPRRSHRRPLSRRFADLHRLAGDPAACARRRARRQRLGLDQPSGTERKRHRALPVLPETDAAAAHRGRPSRLGRGDLVRPDRRHHVRPQSAGRRGQAPALRGSSKRRRRARDHVAGRAAA